MTYYQIQIAKITDTNPILVEAWMTVEHPTFDALSPADFRSAVILAAESVAYAGVEESQRLADSLGVR